MFSRVTDYRAYIRERLRSPPETWMDSPIFHSPDLDRHIYRQLVHMKCFAMCLVTSCIMPVELLKFVHFYLISGLVCACCLVLAFSPHLMWKVLPVFLFVFGVLMQYFTLGLNRRHGIFFIYCIVCCMEVQGFAFVFDLYTIVCFTAQSVYSIVHKKKYIIPAATLCEFAIWLFPVAMPFRLLSTFVWLLIECNNYQQIYLISTTYIVVSLYILGSFLNGFEFEDQMEMVRKASLFLVDSFVLGKRSTAYD